MSKYLTKKRREVEKELLMYLRNYRFFLARFSHKSEFDKLINDIVEELKSDI